MIDPHIILSRRFGHQGRNKRISSYTHQGQKGEFVSKNIMTKNAIILATFNFLH